MRWFVFLALMALLPMELEAAATVGSVTASRSSCLAPCMVFFDATASTDADVSRPIHHLTYCGDSGDGNTDTYDLATGTLDTPKAQFCGSPLFAYVYETPGSYTERHVIYDPVNGGSDTVDTAITVNDWPADATTRCVSTSGTFTGCPSGAQQETSSDFDAHASADDRVLFRCGESFAASTTVNTIGASHIGGFDSSGVVTGLRCQYTVTGTPDPLFAISRDDDVRLTDGIWAGATTSEFLTATADGTGDPDNLLVQNWTLSSTQQIINIGANSQSGSEIPFWHGYFSNTFNDCGNGGGGPNCFFTAIHGLAIVDSILSDSTGAEHVVRLQHAELLFYHDNFSELSGTTKHLLTIRAIDFPSPGFGGIFGRWGELAFISDSHFKGNSPNPVELCASNTNEPVQIRDVIFQRNYHTNNGTIVQRSYVGQGANTTCNDVTIRNDKVDSTGSATFFDFIGSNVDQNGEFYNNSIFSDANGRSFCNNCANCVGKNNVVWDGSGANVFWSGTTCTLNSGDSNFDADGGETGVGNLGSCPFDDCTSPVPITGFGDDGDAELTDAGTSVPVGCSAGQLQRDNSTIDVGAQEEGATQVAPCLPVAFSNGGGGGSLPVSVYFSTQ